jgi:hypothetical protein
MNSRLKALLNAVREWLGWLIVVKICRRIRMVSWFEFEQVTPDGGIAWWRSKNQVTNAGLAWLTALLCGTEADTLLYIAVGTGNTAVDPTHTALQGSELHRHSGTRSQVTSASPAVTNDTFQLVVAFAAGDATGTVEEAAVLDAAAAGTMFARALTGTKVIAAADSLTVTYKITFQRP